MKFVVEAIETTIYKYSVDAETPEDAIEDVLNGEPFEFQDETYAPTSWVVSLPDGTVVLKEGAE